MTTFATDDFQGTEPIQRCCERHTSWATLAEHLIDEFTELTAGDVMTQTRNAKNVVERFGLSLLEQFEVGEVLARHQLMVSAGRLPDVARLDPEVHARRAPIS